MDKISRCSTWAAALWDIIIHKYLKRHGSNTLISSLPDEMILEILSRVPAQSVLSCKVVCSSWHCLTNTPQFIESHLSRAAPVILGLISFCYLRKNVWFVIDDSSYEPRFNKVKVYESDMGRRLLEPRCYASCNGLLIFGESSTYSYMDRYVICNPMIEEQITFELREGDIICGFYFHGLEKEYKLLIYQKDDTNRYSVYGLSTKVRRITLGISKDITVNSPGVAACGALFWSTTDKVSCHGGTTVVTYNIVMFNLANENFVVNPQPTDTYKIDGRIDIWLSEIEGKLGCCHVYLKSIEVWILEEIETWKWVKRYVVDLNGHINKGVDYLMGDAKTHLVGIQNGNMLLYRSYVGLLWCNLRRNEVSKLYTGSTDFRKCYDFANDFVDGKQYICSLVTLRKSNILAH